MTYLCIHRDPVFEMVCGLEKGLIILLLVTVARVVLRAMQDESRWLKMKATAE